MISDFEITQKAEELLHKNKVQDAPVPIEKIVKGLQVLLCPLPAPDDVSGAIIRKDGFAVIAVNPNHHPNRQRFTIAHELGHLLFHEGTLEHVDQNFRVNWRNSESSKAVNWDEIKANRFAAEILMPRDFLRKDLDEVPDLNSESIAQLAKKYEVSPRAMKIRLASLGLIQPF